MQVARINIFSHICYMQTKTYTPAQFAKKIGISRATLWRWTTRKDLEPRLKMYDAKKILVAGKPFIEQEVKKK
jgi:hypothetical protein